MTDFIAFVAKYISPAEIKFIFVAIITLASSLVLYYFSDRYMKYLDSIFEKKKNGITLNSKEEKLFKKYNPL